MAELKARTESKDESVRYWATLGLVVITQTAGSDTVEIILPTLKGRLSDPSLDVRLIAAEGLFNLGYYQEALPAVLAEISHPNTDVKCALATCSTPSHPTQTKPASAIEPLAIARKKFKPEAVMAVPTSRLIVPTVLSLVNNSTIAGAWERLDRRRAH